MITCRTHYVSVLQQRRLQRESRMRQSNCLAGGAPMLTSCISECLRTRKKNFRKCSYHPPLCFKSIFRFLLEGLVFSPPCFIHSFFSGCASNHSDLTVEHLAEASSRDLAQPFILRFWAWQSSSLVDQARGRSRPNLFIHGADIICYVSLFSKLF